jgi:hypothetical protein
MCLRFVFILATRLAAWLRLSRCEEAWKTAEISILRHQLAVLPRRQPGRDRRRRRPGRAAGPGRPSPNGQVKIHDTVQAPARGLPPWLPAR